MTTSATRPTKTTSDDSSLRFRTGALARERQLEDTVNDHERELRAEMVEIGRRLYERDLVAGTDGNISVRLGDGWMLTTPSGVHKGMLRPEQIVKCDLDGRLDGDERSGRPSSEVRMHVLVYRSRPDVSAAVHAHPVHAVALSLVGVSLAECLLPEPMLALGPIPTAAYATPTTEDVPRSLRVFLEQRYNAIVLARHGTLTLGGSLEEAYLRLETVEHAARITATARSIGPTSPLPPEEVARIEQIARDLGIARPTPACGGCGACRQPPESRAGLVEAPPAPTGGEAELPTDREAEQVRRLVLERAGAEIPVGSPRGDNDGALVEEITAAVLRRIGHDRVPPDTSGRG